MYVFFFFFERDDVIPNCLLNATITNELFGIGCTYFLTKQESLNVYVTHRSTDF